MVVQREAVAVQGADEHVLVRRSSGREPVRRGRVEPEALEEPQQQHLEHAGAAVDQHDGGHHDDQEGIARRQHRDADEQPQHARARVAHQHPARLGIVPEVTGQAARHRGGQDRPARAVGVVRHQQVVGDREVAHDPVEQGRQREERDERQRAGESVDPVAAVGRVHREPEQGRGAGDVEPGADRQRALHHGQPDCGRLALAETEGGGQRDQGIEQALLQFAPGRPAGIVEIAEEHGQVEAGDDAQNGRVGRHDQQDHGQQQQTDHEPGPRRLARRLAAAVGRQRLALVTRQAAPEARQPAPDQQAAQQRAHGHQHQVRVEQAQRTPRLAEPFAKPVEHRKGLLSENGKERMVCAYSRMRTPSIIRSAWSSRRWSARQGRCTATCSDW